jgi:hypothetical protein
MNQIYFWFHDRFYTALRRFLGSRQAFYIVMGLFIFQSTWIALTMRYPGAFDENFHLGLIKIYSHQWLPFIGDQPPLAEVYGAVARDPSYLFHYLMSFPYRFIQLFTDSQTLTVILLRLINVAIAATGIMVFARVLARLPMSAAARNVALYFYAAIPVVTLLAGQISYDNLFILLIAYAMLLTIDFITKLRGGNFSGLIFARIMLVCLVAALVKYAFLPIFAALILFLVYELYRFGSRRSLRFPLFIVSAMRPSRQRLYILYAGLFLVFGLLFVERYGINLAIYHTPVPDCAQVLTTEECKQYSPWGRDSRLAAANQGVQRETVLQYSDGWLKQMIYESFFLVYGVQRPDETVDYKVRQPIPILNQTGWFVLVAGLLLIFWQLKRLSLSPQIRLILFTSALYIAVLFYQNYAMYYETATPVAIHGRYVLALVPLLLAVVLIATSYTFKKRWGAVVKAVGLILLVLISTQGGGFITYIVRSDDAVAWQQTETAKKANHLARVILKPIILQD